MNNRSTFLFACPSFIEGMARVMDLGGTMQVYNTSKTEKEADLKALMIDWETVGQDVIISASNYEQKKQGA